MQNLCLQLSHLCTLFPFQYMKWIGVQSRYTPTGSYSPHLLIRAGTLDSLSISWRWFPQQSMSSRLKLKLQKWLTKREWKSQHPFLWRLECLPSQQRWPPQSWLGCLASAVRSTLFKELWLNKAPQKSESILRPFGKCYHRRETFQLNLHLIHKHRTGQGWMTCI